MIFLKNVEQNCFNFKQVPFLLQDVEQVCFFKLYGFLLCILSLFVSINSQHC
jgi:hypothetical protein